ncbi:MAG: virulence RhuM family protein [Candidatus Symbiothrix sp.]|jgi:hypothetical protein|nr:virulence RhuM family protein [Candidatus Symbiothrix sp.]
MNPNLKNDIAVRSSAAEYLTFVAATGDNPQSIEMRYEDENIWLTQKLLATLYDVDVRTINEHIKKIFDDNELVENSVVRNFRITASDGKGYNVMHYPLQMIIAIGFKVNNERAVQFRKWANSIVKDYTVQGWVMDVDRLKNLGTTLNRNYFEKQLELIREIRLSERRFFQKITDIYSTALDYDPTAKTTVEFFKKVQNKLHWAIHGHTAAELIYERADAGEENMGLQTWSDAPRGKIKKSDVMIGKNYLDKKEMRALEQIVSGYLDFAERQAERQIPMTMEDWAKHLDRILMATEHELLTNAGKISMEVARQHAETEWEKYRIVQDRLFESDFDRFLALENSVKNLGQIESKQKSEISN